MHIKYFSNSRQLGILSGMHDTASKHLFPDGVVTACMRLADLPQSGMPPTGNARTHAFKCGRKMAVQALRTLGCEVTDIPKSESGAPVWPKGFTGSITHSQSMCGVVAAHTNPIVSLGMDIEDIPRMTLAVAERICTPDEWAAVQRMEEPTQEAAILFSAKEAVYKCLHPLLNCPIGFQDVSCERTGNGNLAAIPAPHLAEKVPSQSQLVLRYMTVDAVVTAGCTLLIIE